MIKTSLCESCLKYKSGVDKSLSRCPTFRAHNFARAYDRARKKIWSKSKCKAKLPSEDNLRKAMKNLRESFFSLMLMILIKENIQNFLTAILAGLGAKSQQKRNA